ncbi:hypothetical protein DO72_4071 [Burkholderia pseudomallei]|nr:hypothetical protein DO73_3700 [Burkholderia pseudomallei]KOS78962.1 hypothetical protein DM53_3899 [Burkholderia mallei]KGC53895.1 hypothetical protein DO65_5713 [Burkholderia pseudomallei]KGD35075.1 hypothetical protein DO72_4071 [Burkholderia pseudomallei]KGD43090.1 hypothetical protein DP44_5095 [Burkholderia pseudomallei]
MYCVLTIPCRVSVRCSTRLKRTSHGPDCTRLVIVLICSTVFLASYTPLADAAVSSLPGGFGAVVANVARFLH